MKKILGYSFLLFVFEMAFVNLCTFGMGLLIGNSGPAGLMVGAFTYPIFFVLSLVIFWLFAKKKGISTSERVKIVLMSMGWMVLSVLLKVVVMMWKLSQLAI